MDRKITDKIHSKINDYAEEVSEDMREDFKQDMWVLLFAVQEQWPKGSAFNSFLGITLFRARDNWLDRERLRDQRNELLLADAGVEEASSLEGQYNAKEVLQHIVSVLKEAQFTEVEIQTVVEGIREGASQKEIAIAIGRTPQGFNFHWKKFKLAA